jgi:radical SAM-linked protein
MTNDTPVYQRIRVQFGKGDPLKYISHLDLARTWERVFRRAGLPVAHSQGFNPRPRFQIAAALPVGVTGEGELLDIWLSDPLSPEQVTERLRAAAPPGLGIGHAEEVELSAPSLQSQMQAADYRAVVHSKESVDGLRVRIQEFLALPSLLRPRQHKGKWQTYDLRPLVQTLEVEAGEGQERVLSMRLQANAQGAGRPDEVLDALGLAPATRSIVRTNLCLEFDK